MIKSVKIQENFFLNISASKTKNLKLLKSFKKFIQMINSTTNPVTEKIDLTAYNTLDKYLGCLHVFIIFFAFTGNTASFLIFRFDPSMKKISSLVILSFVVVLDNFAVSCWNLNHFLLPNFNKSVTNMSIVTCRLLVFMQYSSLQCSGLLLSLVLIDRYIDRYLVLLVHLHLNYHFVQ